MKRILLSFTTSITLLSHAQTWNEAGKALASDGQLTDWFGASVSINGHYAIVGAHNEDHDAMGGNYVKNAGSAYIFEIDTNGIWSQVQKIVASDRNINDWFGSSVSISGNYAIVGAPLDDPDSLLEAGAAYLFERDTIGYWGLIQKITASDKKTSANFGNSVGISGEFAIVGAFLESTDAAGGDSMIQAGAAYLFRRDISGSWNQAQKLVASDREAKDHFGQSVSISCDYAIIGAPLEDENAIGLDSMHVAGSAYFFEQDVSGNWNQAQKIIASDRETYDMFGFSVSVSGGLAVVGSDGQDENPAGTDSLPKAGAAYIFERDAAGNWNQKQQIVAADREALDQFGMSVSMSGNYVLVGACFEDENATGVDSMTSAGAGYIFQRDTTDKWVQVQKLLASDRDTGDQFGLAVSVSGNHVIIGAWLDADSGSAYFFEGPCGIDISVSQNNQSLISNTCMEKYQWLDCSNNYTPVAGETGRVFTPVVAGNYAVEITKGSCVDTSACYPMTLGIIKSEYGLSLDVYPNPTSGVLTVDFGRPYHHANIKLKNILGQTVFYGSMEAVHRFSLHIEGASGIYLLEINSGEGQSAIIRVVKELR